ncbi:hypothetical protein phiA1122p03 [Yersinia phage phiA1122]|uniref:Uncharacterized protein n=4 Tax=Teseptimavirus TaxID=110456 RepID=I6QAD8_9CAUD|nr:hypothetical protein phiA1122p03 [Yersinia phage phiA1122]YP_009799229.1 hypothetical protein HOS93_gp02 [Yersinia phage YpP-Y]YP_009799280.1 hypothetical protein HOS94_gp07 [Yersinia phage YpsP-G]AFK13399.1 hypothetical protein [Yersinia phage YpP-R]AGB07326.1 hypothetical protein R_03 [Yersinia phage R]AGC35465.1 hypothetical protein Y_03 [Yersinia phage Y]AAP20501.1 protein 1.1 [Yersinia phage phiA1122]AFK13347.1 hypothetical protein [Yersinia phage YpP-Y]
MRNFEKMTKRSNRNAHDRFEVTKGRKFNKPLRTRAHKRNWEGQ